MSEVIKFVLWSVLGLGFLLFGDIIGVALFYANPAYWVSILVRRRCRNEFVSLESSVFVLKALVYFVVAAAALGFFVWMLAYSHQLDHWESAEDVFWAIGLSLVATGFAAFVYALFAMVLLPVLFNPIVIGFLSFGMVYRSAPLVAMVLVLYLVVGALVMAFVRPIDLDVDLWNLPPGTSLLRAVSANIFGPLQLDLSERLSLRVAVATDQLMLLFWPVILLFSVAIRLLVLRLRNTR
jgi:hypothetical protein